MLHFHHALLVMYMLKAVVVVPVFQSDIEKRCSFFETQMPITNLAHLMLSSLTFVLLADGSFGFPNPLSL